MEITITQEVLDEINMFISSKMVGIMNDNGLSFPAMGFILQSLINAIDDAQTELDKDENL